MPARLPSPPKYRHYKPKNLAVVVIDGKAHYLGRYGSPESQEKYHRLIAELLTPRRPPLPRPSPDADPARRSPINELILAYWDRRVVGLLRQGRPAHQRAGQHPPGPAVRSAGSTATPRPATSARWP